MKIEKLQDITSQKGYKINDQFFVAYEENFQFDSSNEDYKDCLQYIKNGGIVLPEFTNQEYLNQAKNKKLADLDNYHDSDEIRNLTIKTSKNLFIYSSLLDARNVLVEQIDANRNGIECGLIPIDKAGFLFFQNGKAEFILLNNLKIIYAKLMAVVNKNYATKLTHKTKISAITNLQDLKNYDFKTNYLANQIIEITQ
jgi:hypothetical protein